MNLWNKLLEHFVGRPLNCQPGDMAVIVRMPEPETSVLIGRVIRVTSLVIDGGDACWEYEGEPLMTRRFGGRWLALGLIEDEFLRPLRDPGPTARDETLDWLPVPGRAREVV